MSSTKAQKWAQRLVQLPFAATSKPVTAEAVTIPAGAAGTLVTFNLAFGMIANAALNDLGGFGDTSIEAVTGELTTEVYFGKPDADLAQGEFYVDYLTGKGRGRKADSGTSIDFTYDYRTLIVDTESATAVEDGDDFTPGTSDIKTAGFYVDETGTGSVTENKVGAARILPKRVQVVSGAQAHGEAIDNDETRPLLSGLRATDPTSLQSAETAGDLVNFAGSLQGEALVYFSRLFEGEDQTNHVLKTENQFVYTNITTATTTVVKSGAGFFHGIMVNKPVAAATIAIYDNTAGSGPLIGTITFGASVLADISFRQYNVKFNTGLTIVTSGATDLTVITRA